MWHYRNNTCCHGWTQVLVIPSLDTFLPITPKLSGCNGKVPVCLVTPSMTWHFTWPVYQWYFYTYSKMICWARHNRSRCVGFILCCFETITANFSETWNPHVLAGKWGGPLPYNRQLPERIHRQLWSTLLPWIICYFICGVGPGADWKRNPVTWQKIW